MRKSSMVVQVFILGLIFVFSFLGCRAAVKPVEEPTKEAPGIEYQIDPGAQLTKVTLYPDKEGVWFVDVAVKNATDKKQAFRVSVKTDDGPIVAGIAGGKDRAPLDPGKEHTVKLNTISKSMPQTMMIRVTPYP